MRVPERPVILLYIIRVLTFQKYRVPNAMVSDYYFYSGKNARCNLFQVGVRKLYRIIANMLTISRTCYKR